MQAPRDDRSFRTAGLGSGDLVADALALLRPRTVVEPALHPGGSWAVSFSAFAHVKLGFIVRGECWLAREGHEPVHLRAGDFYLLVNPSRHVLASDLSAQPERAESLWSRAVNGAVSFGTAAEDAYLCGAQFSFDDINASILIDVLPPLIHVRGGDPQGPLLAHLSELLAKEVGGSALGASLVLEYLVRILFVHMLRAHAEQAHRPIGWLGALKQDGIGAALRAVHADVAYRWTLEELAAVAHMSRSAFAAAFKAQVGSAPLEYVIHWRMSLARDALRQDTRSIAELAVATGYASESAFSTAFRRVVGSSPRQFRDAERTGHKRPAA